MVTCCHALYYPVNSSKKMILYRRCKRKQKAKFSAFLKKRGPVSDLLSEITTEHESYANFLVQEYSLNAATNHEVAVRKLNEKFRVFGKDDEFFQVVFLAFRKLVENSAKLPNAHIVTTVITVAGKRGYLSEADFAFGWSQTSCDSKLVRPTAFTYTAYIQAIGQNVRGDSWVLAFDIFDDMISNGLIPNVFTYSALIRTGVRGWKNGAQRVSSFHTLFQFLYITVLTLFFFHLN